jgi:ABC-type iron transport system FetAB ATPase subunit
MGAPNTTWEDVARNARQALELLGFPLDHCMPGEDFGPDGCGRSVDEHAVAYLVSLQELAGHQLQHLGPPQEMLDHLRQFMRDRLCECAQAGKILGA